MKPQIPRDEADNNLGGAFASNLIMSERFVICASQLLSEALLGIMEHGAVLFTCEKSTNPLHLQEIRHM